MYFDLIICRVPIAHQDRVDVSGGAVVELGHREGDRLLLQLKVNNMLVN